MYLCQAIEEFSRSLEPFDENQAQNQLTPHFEEIANALVMNSQRVADDDVTNNLIVSSYTGLTTLC